jgi:hypothetical protein
VRGDQVCARNQYPAGLRPITLYGAGQLRVGRACAILVPGSSPGNAILKNTTSKFMNASVPPFRIGLPCVHAVRVGAVIATLKAEFCVPAPFAHRP